MQHTSPPSTGSIEQALAALGFPESEAGIQFLRACMTRDTKYDECAVVSDVPLPFEWF
ncbi:hypothetical protein [Nitrospirillum iridis]|uniref:Uncharacterized protein n=1 Tax=Nitrospirillum iridis TaxID=765888 RepID=A0A7X0EFA3_9PROT|nr:hypothetical protein [Nitrospirillum iridis]MBB6252856.1 hypothetical protein [Nitrospirillum iridis]